MVKKRINRHISLFLCLVIFFSAWPSVGVKAEKPILDAYVGGPYNFAYDDIPPLVRQYKTALDPWGHTMLHLSGKVGDTFSLANGSVSNNGRDINNSLNPWNDIRNYNFNYAVTDMETVDVFYEATRNPVDPDYWSSDNFTINAMAQKPGHVVGQYSVYWGNAASEDHLQNRFYTYEEHWAGQFEIMIGSVSLEKESISIAVGDTARFSVGDSPFADDTDVISMGDYEPKTYYDGTPVIPYITAESGYRYQTGFSPFSYVSNSGTSNTYVDITGLRSSEYWPESYGSIRVSIDGSEEIMDTCEITVIDTNDLKLAVDPTELSLKVGESQPIAATVTPVDYYDKDVSYTSSAPNIATIIDGDVTAVGKGTAIITASLNAHPEITAICNVSVSEGNEEPTPTPTPVPTPPPGAVTVELSLEDYNYEAVSKVDYIDGSLGLYRGETWFDTNLILSAMFSNTYTSAITGVNAIVTAPDGFSFSPDSIQKSYRFPVFDIVAGSGGEYAGGSNQRVKLYPLYDEKYETEKSAEFNVEFLYGTVTGYDDLIIDITKPELPTEGSPYEKSEYFDLDWNIDNFTTKSSSEYDQDTSIFAASLSDAVYDESSIIIALTNLGFTEIVPNLYPNADRLGEKCAYTLAKKKIVYEENGVEYVDTLVAVLIRGTTGGWEWLSNIMLLPAAPNVTPLGYHSDFYTSYDIIRSHLRQYVTTPPERTRYFITGHSRAASAANILGQRIRKSGLDMSAIKSKTYVYTYAAPNASTLVINTDEYDNIHNVLNNADAAPRVPPTPLYRIWGQRYYFTNPEGFEDFNFIARLGATLKGPAHNMALSYIPAVKAGKLSRTPEREDDLIGTADYLVRKIFNCPVDIYVFNEQGELAGQIVGDTVTNNEENSLYLFVDGETKHVWYSSGTPYTVKIIGNDTGTLDYTVSQLDLTTFETVSETVFTDVALYDGKQIESVTDEEVTTLTVLDDYDTPIATVAADGTETRLAEPTVPSAYPGAIVVAVGDTNTFNLSLGTKDDEYAETAYVKSEDESTARINVDESVAITTSGAAITSSQTIPVTGEEEGVTEITVELEGGNFTGEAQRTVTVIVVDKAEVTFFDGDDELATGRVTKGKPLGITQWPDVPTKDGYAFDGWYTGPDGGGDPFKISTVINGDTEVYAAWLELPEDTPPPQDETYRINVSAGTGGAVSGGGTYNEGASVTLAAAPNRNYRFSGWYENGSRIIGAGTIYVFTAERDRTLEARFSYSPPDDGNDDDDDDNDNNNNRRNDRDRDNDDNNSSSTNVWTGVNNRITEAKTGETVTVNTNNNAAVPTNLINAVKGKDVNFVVNIGTYSWTINGLSVQTIPSNLTYYNLSVSKIINVPISALAGNKDVALLELPHKGVFPFTPVLEWRLGETYKDSTLFLYYYNETNKTLEYLYEVLTDAKGNAKLTLTQGGKYALVSEKLTGGATEELPEATEPPVAEPEPTQTHTPEPTTPEPTPTPQPTPAPVVPQAPVMLVLNENMPADELGFRPFMFMSLESVGYKYGVIRVKDVLTFMNAQSTWDNATGSATITGTDRNGMPLVIVLTNNSPTMTVNGVTYDIAEYSGAPDLRGLYTTYNAGGALYLPCRAIANAFGVSLEWNGETATAIIRK